MGWLFLPALQNCFFLCFLSLPRLTTGLVISQKQPSQVISQGLSPLRSLVSFLPYSFWVFFLSRYHLSMPAFVIHVCSMSNSSPIHKTSMICLIVIDWENMYPANTAT